MARAKEVYVVADALALAFGPDAVTPAAVQECCGGRRRELVRLLKAWRKQRAPFDFLRGRAERKRKRGGSAAALESVAPEQVWGKPPCRGTGRAGQSPMRRKYAALLAAPPPPRAPRDFLAGKAERRLARATRGPVNRRPEGVPKAKRSPRKRPPPLTAEARQARDKRVRAYVLKARTAHLERMLAASAWQKARHPEVARAVVVELASARRPLWPAHLARRAGIPLKTSRPSTELNRALLGARLHRTASNTYWFDGEPLPGPRQFRVPPAETAYSLVREFGELLWQRVLEFLRSTARAQRPAAIASALAPEIRDLHPDWLYVRLQREARAGVIARGNSGWTLPR